MKTFTDFNQSKILAKFLPVESADLYYLAKDDRGTEFFSNPSVKDGVCEDIDVPCWSLAALLAVVSKELCVTAGRTVGGSGNEDWCVYCEHTPSYYHVASNPVDACYEMILDLYKHKML